MCTALSFHGLFGRTLDLEYDPLRRVVAVPRQYPLPLRGHPTLRAHWAMVGTARVEEGCPLFFDAMNEHGLCMAALHFPRSAHYPAPGPHGVQVAPFDLIGWVLGRCVDVARAKALLTGVTVAHLDFSPRLPSTPLHWLLADPTGRCLVVEPTRAGLQLYDHPTGVLTNEPELPCQLLRLEEHLALSPDPPENRLLPGPGPALHSRGLGACGLPGDFSSPSRFVRAAFLARNARPHTGPERVVQFFHIMDSLCPVEGCVRVEGGDVRSVYTCCCDPRRRLYHLTTYRRRDILSLPLSPIRGSRLTCLWQGGQD